jgi:hypothetical protein
MLDRFAVLLKGLGGWKVSFTFIAHRVFGSYGSSFLSLFGRVLLQGLLMYAARHVCV